MEGSASSKTANKISKEAPSTSYSGRSRQSPLLTSGRDTSFDSAREYMLAFAREDVRLIVNSLAERMEVAHREQLDAHTGQILKAIRQNGEPALSREVPGGIEIAETTAVPPAVLRPVVEGHVPTALRPVAESDGAEPPPPAMPADLKPPALRPATREPALQAVPLRCQATEGYSPSAADLEVFAQATESVQGFLSQVEDEMLEGPRAWWRPLQHKCERLLSWWRADEERPRLRRLDQLVDSVWFQRFCTVVILVNSVCISMAIDYQLKHPGRPIDPVTARMEMGFVAWYTLEVLLRITSHGKYFFVGRDFAWNLFDLLLVLSSLVQLLLVWGWTSIAFVRSVRVFKIYKVLRVIRFLEFMKDVRIMVVCVVHSLMSVVWCLVLILFLLFLFSILILQAVAVHIEDDIESGSEFATLLSYFSSVGATMVVLFQSTTGGRDWCDVYALLGSTGMWWMRAAYLFYIAFMTIAIWNIVTAIFVEKAMHLTRPVKEQVILRERHEQLKDLEALNGILDKCDVDRSTTLSLAEFERLCRNPVFTAFLESRGIQIREAKTFFVMVSQSVGTSAEVDTETMLACCLRIRGMATSIDLHTMRFEMRSLLTEQRRILDQMRSGQ